MGLDITTKYSKNDVTRLTPHLSNWLKTHSYIRTLKDSEESLIELQKMISIEIATNKRIQMVTRMLSRFTAMRARLENQILFGKVPELN